jgi:lipoprotein
MNMTMKRLSLGISLLTLLAGCGSSDDAGNPASPAGPANPSGATGKAMVTQAALPAQSLLVDNDAKPISGVGIRADVLATALTQSTSTVDAYTDEADEPPVIRIKQNVRATESGNGITQPFYNDYRVYLDDIGDNDTFSSVRVMTGLSANKLPDNLDKAAADAAVLTIDVAQRIEKGEILDRAYARVQAHATHMQIVGPWTLKRNMVLMYDAGPLSWEDHAGTTQVVMRAQRGNRSSDFGLCTEVGIGDFSRTSCALWRVPKKWKPGKALTYRGQRVTERHLKQQRDEFGNITGTVSRPITWQTR